MKTERADQSDPTLHKLLREWEVSETLPPRFQERVWQRLARREAQQSGSLWGLLLERFTSALARPSLAVSYVTMLLLLGLATGYWQAHQQNVQAAASLGARYVQMLDPYQMPRR
jgi:hypothetical protein